MEVRGGEDGNGKTPSSVVRSLFAPKHEEENEVGVYEIVVKNDDGLL